MPANNKKQLLESFLAAAARGVKEQEKAERKARLKAAREEKILRETERTVFAEFEKVVQPLLDKLSALPSKDGKEFFFRVVKNVQMTLEGTPRSDLTVTGVYSNALAHWADNYRSGYSGEFPAKNRDGQGHGTGKVRVRRAEASVFTLEHNPNAIFGTGVRAGTHHEGVKDGPTFRISEVDVKRQSYKSLGDIPAVLGAWVAEVAPERLPELQSLKQKKPAKGPRP